MSKFNRDEEVDVVDLYDIERKEDEMLNIREDQIDMFQAAIKLKIEEETEKSVVDFDKTLTVAVAKLVAEGWTLPAELPISAVNALGKSSKLNDINDFMKLLYSSDNYQKMKAMVYSIQNSNIKLGLIKVVTECWNAFQNKLYTICAISLLTVIEGILSEFSSNKKKTNMKDVCLKYIATLPKDGSIIIKHVWFSYEQFIMRLYQSSDFTATEPNDINRHWLLHGRSDFDVDEIECMRLFNAVHSLCMIKNKEAQEE